MSASPQQGANVVGSIANAVIGFLEAHPEVLKSIVDHILHHVDKQVNARLQSQRVTEMRITTEAPRLSDPDNVGDDGPKNG